MTTLDKVKAWVLPIALAIIGAIGLKMVEYGEQISNKLERLTILVEREAVKREYDEKRVEELVIKFEEQQKKLASMERWFNRQMMD